MNTTVTRRRFLTGSAATVALLAVKVGANALPSGPAESTSALSPCLSRARVAMPVIVPDILAWLAAHPTIANSKLWMRPSTGMEPFSNWNADERGSLVQAFGPAYRDQSSGQADPPGIIYENDGFSTTVLTPTEAWDLNIAHVAHSLAVELRGDLPWSITSMNASETRYLFSWEWFFGWNTEYGGTARPFFCAEPDQADAHCSTFYNWFGPPALPNAARGNVGRRVDKLAVTHLPLGLLGCYVLDLSTGLTPATGKVAEYLGPRYSLAQLQAMDLWGKMDAKIAAHGGAAAISAAVTAAEQARKV